MNEITLTGNVSKIHDRRITASGVTIFSFDLAIDNSYFHHTRNRWIPRTGSNRSSPTGPWPTTANTLTQGTAITVTGKLLDDSFSPDGSDYVVRRDKLEALDVAVSLRFATAVATKAGKSTEQQGLEHHREQLAATA